MNTTKVAPRVAKGNAVIVEGFDHYVAVDWSEQTMAIAHMGRRLEEPVVFERSANLKSLKEYLETLRGRIVLVVEETTTAQWLYLELRDAVERIVICNPHRNRLLSDGPKTDKIDASKLCMLLRSGLLKEVFHSADAVFELRHLVSAYEDLVKAGVRLLNQRSATERGRCQTGDHGSFVKDRLDKSIQLYQETKQQYEAKFRECCRHNKQLKLLLPVPGIGVIGAVKILATVVDPRRFRRRGQYLSYCGLVRNDKLSGGRSYGSRIPRYNRTLKSVYKTAALSAIGGKSLIRQYYEVLLERGVAEHNARHTIARYLARITYGILKTETSYNPYLWRNSIDTHEVA
jgi:transposase